MKLAKLAATGAAAGTIGTTVAAAIGDVTGYLPVILALLTLLGLVVADAAGLKPPTSVKNLEVDFASLAAELPALVAALEKLIGALPAAVAVAPINVTVKGVAPEQAAAAVRKALAEHEAAQ